VNNIDTDKLREIYTNKNKIDDKTNLLASIK